MAEDPAEPEAQANQRAKRFLTRRLRAFQPLLAPKVVLSIYVVLGVVFVGLGVAILVSSGRGVEYSFNYTNEPVSAETSTAYFDILIDKDMAAPIWLYYELSGYHQNHRNYRESRDDEQLKGERIASQSDDCFPWATSEDGRPNYPCGLVARSVFNDTYLLQVKPAEESTFTRLDVDTTSETIAWSSDASSLFRNRIADGSQVDVNMWIVRQFPPVECRQINVSPEKPFVPTAVALRRVAVQGSDSFVEVPDCGGYGAPQQARCNFSRLGRPFECSGDYAPVQMSSWGVESGHFMVWMRTAGLPFFRKLWGRLDRDLPAGSVLRVHFAAFFPVQEYRGQKSFVLSTGTVYGGPNGFLGIGYLVLGCCCIGFGVICGLVNFSKPRVLGDMGLIRSGSEGVS